MLQDVIVPLGVKYISVESPSTNENGCYNILSDRIASSTRANQGLGRQISKSFMVSGDICHAMC